MEIKFAALRYEKVTQQRNFFVVGVIILAISNFLLCLKIFLKEEKIIMVPGITREMSIIEGKVSNSYLEESSLLFLSTLLDLTPDTVKHKRDIILKYISGTSQKELQEIKDYFSKAETEHIKFTMSTYFTPIKLDLFTRELKVIAEGKLTSNFGKKGYESRDAKYYLSFELVAGHLKLKEFYEIELPKNRNTL